MDARGKKGNQFRRGSPKLKERFDRTPDYDIDKVSLISCLESRSTVNPANCCSLI